MQAQERAYDLLLVEDDLGDAGLVKIALRRGQFDVRLHHVKDGDDALAFLRDRESPRPHLVLLDLNLPGRSGHEVLEEIKSDAELKTIPVVVLSTSEAQRDVVKAYFLGANSFVSKPMDVEDFTNAIHVIETYWFRTIQLMD